MNQVPIGVANSVSANFQFDPLDTLNFARQSQFDIVQIYLNEDTLDNARLQKEIIQREVEFREIFYHAAGSLNNDFYQSDYHRKLFDFLERSKFPNYILHFDERAGIDELIEMVNTLSESGFQLFLENYFCQDGAVASEKNLKKYMALFTLTRNFGGSLLPVLDFPRIFNQNTGLDEAQALEWCFQIVNFFGNRQIPVLLHLIDSADSGQARSSFRAIGEGIIPYSQILNFIKKTRPALRGIILEFEDKINPLHSRDYLVKMLQQ